MNARKLYLTCLALVFIFLNCSNKQPSQEDPYFRQRKAMVENQIKKRGIKNEKVLQALMTVPRHEFVDEAYRKHAYEDRPLPIENDQTISQPYIVAYMTEILDPQATQRVLEIGTGSGYQAAILSKVYKEVYSIEIIAPLGEHAKKLLAGLRYNNIEIKIGDGYLGWPEHAPYNAIIVTCAPDKVPQPLVDQLAEGGKIIIPVGESFNQSLYLLEKTKGRIYTTKTLPVRFVPMLRESDF